MRTMHSTRNSSSIYSYCQCASAGSGGRQVHPRQAARGAWTPVRRRVSAAETSARLRISLVYRRRGSGPRARTARPHKSYLWRRASDRSVQPDRDRANRGVAPSDVDVPTTKRSARKGFVVWPAASAAKGLPPAAKARGERAASERARLAGARVHGHACMRACVQRECVWVGRVGSPLRQLGMGCKMSDARCQMQDVRCKMSDAR